MEDKKFINLTERLVIREVSISDEVYIYEAASSCPKINMMHGNEFKNKESVSNYIEVLKKEYKNEKYKTLALADRCSDKFLGLITLDVDKIFPRAEISYWIDKRYRNKGYATESVKAIIKYGFSKLGLNRIQGMHFTNNPASGRVLEKAGMLYEGTLRQYVGMDDKFYDCKMYSILKLEYQDNL